jgi:O-acetyl-ADP-ribose deacetylase (regulator of RNase III)
VLGGRAAGALGRLHPFFGEHANVEVGFGDIFEATADSIVSPANSFGYMDGGIDAAYLARFGAGLQSRLQQHLR